MAGRRDFGTIRRMRSKRWQASYIGPDADRHHAPTTYTRKGDAEAWLNAERRLIELDEWRAPSDRAATLITAELPTLGAWAETCIQRRQNRARRPIKPSTAQMYRQLIRLTLGPIQGLRIDRITPAAIQAWYDNLDPAAPTQRANAYALIRSLFLDAVHDEMIPTSPCRIRGASKPEPVREGIALTVGQLLAYLDAVGAVTRDRDRDAALDRRMALMIAAWCSLRSGEVRALRRRDVADDGTVVHVERAVTRIGEPGKPKRWHFDTPKTTAGRRTVAVPPGAAQILAAWLMIWDGRHTDPDRLLFAAANGIDPLHDGVLRKAHKRGAEAIGMPGLTVHDLRRTGATLAAQSGATIRELMRRLGHTKPDVAMIYQTADDERDRALAQRMSVELELPAALEEAQAAEFRPWGLRIRRRPRSIFLD